MGVGPCEQSVCSKVSTGRKFDRYRVNVAFAKNFRENKKKSCVFEIK